MLCGFSTKCLMTPREFIHVLFILSLGRIWNFFHKLSSSSNFGYGATTKLGPSADYIGIKVFVLPLNQLEFTVIELIILQRILLILAFYSHYNIMFPICIKALYRPLYINLHKIRTWALTTHQGLISKSMQIQQSRQIKVAKNYSF